jgi:hypothetical protein
MDTNLPITPAVRSYDITPVVQRGHNTISVLMTCTTFGQPHLLVDGEIEDHQGNQVSLASNASWLSQAGFPADWSGRIDSAAPWQPVNQENGDLDILPWKPERHNVAFELPIDVFVWRLVAQGLWIVGAAVITIALAWLTARLAARGPGRTEENQSSRAAIYLALVPAIVLIGGGILASYDPRLSRDWLYSPAFFLAAVGLVLVQWLIIIAAARLGTERLSNSHSADVMIERRRRIRARIGLAVLIPLFLVGGWLRYRLIRAEPLNPDEVTVYRAAEGVWHRVLPSFVIHPDMPVFYMTTSELMFYPVALAMAVFRDDCFVVRFPAVCWSMLTLWLIYVAGRRMFRNQAVGLVAAAIYALSPVVIQMTNFGRYFAQLQFMALAVVYFFWLTIEGAGPINRRALWLTVIFFIAMFLSWEASALIAIGMMAGAMIERRGRLRSVLGAPAVYAGMLLILVVIIGQISHRTLRQYERLWYGTGASDITLTPMWRYPDFSLWYYIHEASWNRDYLLPIIGLIAGLALALMHPYRRQARFLLFIFLITAWIQALGLPVKAPRYAYHLTPILILLASAALVAALRALINLGRQAWVTRDTSRWRICFGAGGWACAIAVIALASGITIQTTEITWAHSAGYRLTQYKFADMEAPIKYLRDHLQDGDVVMSTAPHVVDHVLRLMGSPRDQGLSTDMWPQSKLHLQASLDDHRALPLHRLYGVVMPANMESMREAFSRNGRIWYVVDPTFNHIIQEEEITSYFRQHMEVVYEDFSSIVMLAGEKHRPAFIRLADEAALRTSRAKYLP